MELTNKNQIRCKLEHLIYFNVNSSSPKHVRSDHALSFITSLACDVESTATWEGLAPTEISFGISSQIGMDRDWDWDWDWADGQAWGDRVEMVPWPGFVYDSEDLDHVSYT